MIIREYVDTDHGDVIALWHRCGLTRPWNDPATDLDLAVRGEQSTILVAELNGGPVATVMVGFDGHRGWVYYLGVDPAHRRQGLARRLMREAEQWLRARQAPKIQLMIRHDNTDAIGFYMAMGYQEQAVVTYGRRLDENDMT
ncbi:MAG: GNAT family acetyltransferase [Pseudomonadota bacterium]